ncbi:DUF6962 family protein [Chloroflexota bacterium]
MALIDTPTERTTAATDAILALLALGCGLYLLWFGQSDPWKAGLWAGIFGLLALSAVLGAVAHGFKMSAKTNARLWQPLNLTLGLIVGLFVVAIIYDLWGLPAVRWTLPLMIGVGIAFFAVTQMIPDTFLVFVVYQIGAMLFALVAYGWLAINQQLAGAGLMAAGILVTMMAAGVQAGQSVSFTFIWKFDHNGAYHLIQMAGIILLTAGLRATFLAANQF